MKILEKIILALQILNIAAFAYFIFTIPEDKTEYKEVVANQDKKRFNGNENFVFFGDSITEWYDLDEYYEDDIPVVNSGFAGLKTKELAEKLQNEVYKYNPTKVFILIGTNDLNSDTKEEVTLENINNIIKDIQKNRRQAKIYIESIYPINRTDDEIIDMTKVGIRTNKRIQEINKKIEKIAQENKVTYINVYDELTDEDGNLAIKYTKDGLHMSALGYAKITKTLMPYILN